MEKDIIDLDEMAQILHKSKNTVRSLIKQKKIPATLLGGAWHSSRLALSMCVAGYDPAAIYEKIAEKVLKESAELFV